MTRSAEKKKSKLDHYLRSQVVHIAVESKLPSLPAVKRTSASDSRNIGEAQRYRCSRSIHSSPPRAPRSWAIRV
jgi:hypothetical protein